MNNYEPNSLDILAKVALEHGMNKSNDLAIIPSSQATSHKKATKTRGRPKLFMDQLTSALEDKSNLSILKWCDNGTGFIVLNWDDLCLSLIPKLFVKESQAHQSLETEKTMSSVDLVLKRRSTFLKQLNNYQFSKSHCKRTNRTTFIHDGFRRDNVKACRALTPRLRNRSGETKVAKKSQIKTSTCTKAAVPIVCIDEEFEYQHNITNTSNPILPFPPLTSKETPVPPPPVPPHFNLFPGNYNMINVCNMSSFVYMRPSQQVSVSFPHNIPQAQHQSQNFMSSMMLWPTMTPLKVIEPSLPADPNNQLGTSNHLGTSSVNQIVPDNNDSSLNHHMSVQHNLNSKNTDCGAISSQKKGIKMPFASTQGKSPSINQGISPGVGRKCEHRFLNQVKPLKGATTQPHTNTLVAKCGDLCGSVVRRCPDCLQWTNHNNFYRHAAKCTKSVVEATSCSSLSQRKLLPLQPVNVNNLVPNIRYKQQVNQKTMTTASLSDSKPRLQESPNKRRLLQGVEKENLPIYAKKVKF